MRSTLQDRPRGWWSNQDVIDALKRIKDTLESGLGEENGGMDTYAAGRFSHRFGLAPAAFCVETVATNAQLYVSVGAPASGWWVAASVWMRTAAAGGELRLIHQGTGTPTNLMPATAATGDDVVTEADVGAASSPIGTTDELAIEAVLGGGESFTVIGGVLWQKYEHMGEF